eukprot:467380-Prorocentrum_minimum.AAC.1
MRVGADVIGGSADVIGVGADVIGGRGVRSKGGGGVGGRAPSGMGKLWQRRANPPPSTSGETVWSARSAPVGPHAAIKP